MPRTADATASVKGYYIEPGSYNLAIRMSRLPFRLQLNGTVDERTTTLLTRILDSHIRNASLSDILEIIETADELVLWQLARQLHERNVRSFNMGVFPNDQSEWLQAVSRLIARALRDADAEGVVWTPLLDALADSMAWIAIIAHRQKTEPKIPSAIDRAEQLIPWISGVDDPAMLYSLLKYRSEALHQVLAGHVRVFDSTLLSGIPLSGPIIEQLSQNPAIDDQSRNALVERVYETWKTAIGDGFRPDGLMVFEHFGERQADIVVMFLDRGFSLPSSARAHAFDLVRNNEILKRSDRALDFLIRDQSTPGDLLDQLPLDLKAGNFLVRVMVHPNCSDALWNRLSANADALKEVLLHHQVSASRVAMAYERCMSSPFPDSNLLYTILKQENGTPDMWLAAIRFADATQDRKLRGNIFAALGGNRSARQMPEVRSALLRSDMAGIVLGLLSDRRPDEFESLMLKLFRTGMGVTTAISFLKKHGVPVGTPFPRKLVEHLLRSDSSETRLLGISLIADFQIAESTLQELEPNLSEEAGNRAPPASRS